MHLLFTGAIAGFSLLFLSEVATAAEWKPPAPYREFVFVDAELRGGLYIDGLAPGPSDTDTLTFGGRSNVAFTLGGHPGGRAFAIAGRLHAGSYLSNIGTPLFVGGAALFGATLGSSHDVVPYVFGGLGADVIKDFERTIPPFEGPSVALTIQALGGVSVRGWNVGGGFNMAGGGPYYNFMFGAHIGYAWFR